MVPRNLVFVLGVSFLVGCSSSGTVRSSVPPADGSQTGVSSSNANVAASVVRVTTRGTFVKPEFGQSDTLAGSGSAFIIDQSGLAVTNNHVVAGAAAIEVFTDGSSTAIPAQLVATSECSDLAVIDLAGDGYQPISWAGSDPEVGKSVEALGFPNGVSSLSVTDGIVSDTGQAGSTSWSSITSLLRHDAQLVPGNSGGPLVADGVVVGVNVAASVAGQFAIPMSVALPVVDQLVTGIGVDSIGVNATAVHDDATNASGVWVSSVEPGSRADAVGLLPGDVISRMRGLRIATDGTLADYCAVLRSAGNGEIPIEVTRGDTYLAGSLGGQLLEMKLIALSDTQESVAKPPATVTAPPTGIPYDSFVNVTDDTGSLSFDLPAAWSDHRTAPIQFASAMRPTIAGAVNVDALDTAAGSTYDVAGVAAIVFDAASPIDESFRVVMDNSAWNFDCVSSPVVAFDDGLYSGVIQAFVGCNANGATVISLGLQRSDQDQWLLANVFAPTLADLHAAQRIATTLQLTNVGAAPSVSQPGIPPIVSTDSLDLLSRIGVPPTAATEPVEQRQTEQSVTNVYSVSATAVEISTWMDSIATAVGCVDIYHGSSTGENSYISLSCDIADGDNRLFNVSIRALWFNGSADVEIEVIDLRSS